MEIMLESLGQSPRVEGTSESLPGLATSNDMPLNLILDHEHEIQVILEADTLLTRTNERRSELFQPAGKAELTHGLRLLLKSSPDLNDTMVEDYLQNMKLIHLSSNQSSEELKDVKRSMPMIDLSVDSYELFHTARDKLCSSIIKLSGSLQMEVDELKMCSE
jgi:hypothetical protein